MRDDTVSVLTTSGVYAAPPLVVERLVESYFGSVNQSVTALRRAVTDHLGHVVDERLDPITLIVMGAEYGLTPEYLTTALAKESS